MIQDRKIGNYKVKAFTLIELLVVIAVLALLLSVLVPSLVKAKQQCRTTVCSSNIRQLVLANLGYTTENDGKFVLAAPDIFTSNLKRWHGVRDDINSFFDATRSPLAPYFADGQVKRCPMKIDFRNGDPWDWDFEQGAGGYGYNMIYLGSRTCVDFTADNCARPTTESEVNSTAMTLMFADAAMTKLDADGQPYYLEYSFAEPYYFVVNGKPEPSWGQPSPSIHFRHDNRANVGWCDGHVAKKEIALDDSVNVYGVKSYDMQIGWFKPLDNSYFDLK